MRPGQHNKRGRNRNRRHSGGGGGGGGGGNPLNRVYESNGPDVKVRGTAQTIADKYLQLGRDAFASGDTVMSESYFQHAEHYLRILAAAQAYNQQFQQQNRRPNGEDGYEDEEGDYEGEGDDAQPSMVERPLPQAAQSEPYPENQPSDFDRAPAPPQNQSNFRSRDRGGDRFRPRYEQNRDRQEPSRDRDEVPASRQEAVPARAEPAPAEQPAQGNNSWEAPSFLKRASANGSSGETPRTRYPRRRKESAEATETPAGGPSRETPAE